MYVCYGKIGLRRETCTKKTNARKERLNEKIEVAKSTGDNESIKLLQYKAERKLAKKGPFTAEERLERKRASARRCRAAAHLREHQELTKAEWVAAGRPGETACQREARLKHNELARQWMRKKREERRGQKGQDGEKTDQTEKSGGSSSQ